MLDDLVLILFISVISVCVIIGMFFIFNGMIGNSAFECVGWHKEEKTHPAWTQLLYAGNYVLIPIHHPAYNYTATVCDKYENKTNLVVKHG